MLIKKQNIFNYIKNKGVVYESELIIEFAKSDLPSKHSDVYNIISELLYCNKIQYVGNKLLAHTNRKFYA